MDGLIVVLYVYAFVVGICVASFINVVIWRVPQEMSIAKGRSFCPSCMHTLRWYDLIPLASYLMLRGKCRYCGAKIPMRDTLLEFAGGLIAMVCFYYFQFQWDTIVVFVLFMILLAITMIDFDTMTIPNGLIIALMIPVLILSCMHNDITWVNRIIGFFCISLPMYLLILAIPDCFGGGDVKLIAVGGFLLGWKLTLLAAFVAVLLGGAYAIVLLTRKKTKKGAHIAFGPYICVGIVISLLHGNDIIHWYLSLFNLN